MYTLFNTLQKNVKFAKETFSHNLENVQPRTIKSSRFFYMNAHDATYIIIIGHHCHQRNDHSSMIVCELFN